jgi:GT2 family glycosyltransferase
LAPDGVTIEVSETDYNQAIARDLIRYVFGAAEDARDDDTSDLQRRYLLIKFRNTNLLYGPGGFAHIEGDFEPVDIGDFNFLLSAGDYFHSRTLKPLRFEPYSIQGVRKPAKPFLTEAPPIVVIVPIYGNLLNTFETRQEIETFASELAELRGRVLLAVDGHDTRSQTLQHLEILSDLDLECVDVFSHDRNLGFIQNVNFLFSKTREDEIVVLLTTDVKMQPYTLTRVIAPLVNTNTIALSTPYAIGGENLEAPESEIRHWRDLDAILSALPPAYPDAETNVGYLLAVDRRKYPGTVLFDKFFENGYGDDSDLYYRCVNLGFRGVVADNCCVLHEHGASFSHTSARSELQIANHRRFMERWGQVYSGRHKTATQAIAQRKERQARIASALSRNATRPEIAFVLPTNDRRIGGVAAVFDLAETLFDQGLPTAVLCTSRPQSDGNAALKTISADDYRMRDAVLASASWILATSHDTCHIVKSLADSNDCTAGYFVQGPEFSFSNGHFLSSVLTGFQGFQAVFTVSAYLAELVRAHTEVPIHLIPYGPPRYKYFETSSAREPRSIAIQLNGNPNKGASYAAGVIAALIRHGYHFYSFGDENLRGTRRNFCHHLGFLSTAEKVRLFNRVEFYLDASDFEGLGLLLMESVKCGAIPIYRHNGGSADLLKRSTAGIEVGDYAAIGRIHEQLSRFRDESAWEAERGHCKEAIRGHSREAAAAAFRDWWDAQHR